MRKAFLMAVPVLCLAGAAPMSPAFAQRLSPITGGKLLAMCASKAAPGQRMCEAYVSGMADMIGFTKASTPDKAPPVCVPDSATGAELREKTIAYLSTQSKNVGEHAARQVFEALKAAYPCSGKSE